MPNHTFRLRVSYALTRAALISSFALAIGCGGDAGTSPEMRRARIVVLAGANLTDTVAAVPNQALVVEINDSTGQRRSGATVRFEALHVDDPKGMTDAGIALGSVESTTFEPFASDVTDAIGQAKVRLAFGTYVGTVRVRVSVPLLGLVDTVPFTVKPGAPIKLALSVRDTTVGPGGSYTIGAAATDRFGNPVPGEVLTYASGPGIAALTPEGHVTVGQGISRLFVLVKSRLASDTAHVTVVLPLPAIANRFTSHGNTVTRVNVDGTSYSELTSSTSVSLFPQQSKSSDLVVYYEGNPANSASLWKVRPGSAAQMIVGSPMGFANAAWPRWSPDDRWIYFVGNRLSGSARSLWRIHPDGSELDSLTTITQSVIAAPTVAPNGNSVAVEDAEGVRVYDLTTRTSRFVNAPCTMPQYSPDGTRFACIFEGPYSAEPFRLGYMNVDGSGQKIFDAATQSNANGVDWTPDGQWLLSAQVYLIAPPGVHILQSGDASLVSIVDGAIVPLTILGRDYTQLTIVR